VNKKMKPLAGSGRKTTIQAPRRTTQAGKRHAFALGCQL
jgi:hypothetical protein